MKRKTANGLAALVAFTFLILFLYFVFNNISIF